LGELLYVGCHIVAFPKAKFELELLGSRRNVDLAEDQVDTLWTWVHAATDSLASHVPPLVTRSPPGSAEE
jgi:hypothetical protein